MIMTLNDKPTRPLIRDVDIEKLGGSGNVT
jgi:hypothetical protein